MIDGIPKGHDWIMYPYWGMVIPPLKKTGFSSTRIELWCPKNCGLHPLGVDAGPAGVVACCLTHSHLVGGDWNMTGLCDG